MFQSKSIREWRGGQSHLFNNFFLGIKKVGWSDGQSLFKASPGAAAVLLESKTEKLMPDTSESGGSSENGGFHLEKLGISPEKIGTSTRGNVD